MQDILREIQIVMGKGSTHIVFFLMSAVRELLELRYDQIIRSCPLAERSHAVMDFFSAVDTQDHIAHLLIGKFHDVII